MRALLVAVVFVCACSPSNRSGGDDGSNSNAPLRVVPDSVTLTVDGAAATQTYQVIAHDGDGDHDVTSQATLALGNPTIGTMSGATLTTSTMFGGHSKVTATYDQLTASSDLTVLMEKVVVDPGAPQGAPGMFMGGQPGGGALQLVYPQPGVIVPPNMNSFEFHFIPAAGQTLFDLTFTGSAIQLDVYFTCTTVGAGCVWTPSADTWNILATAGRGDLPISYTVRGLDGNNQIGASGAQTIQFTVDDLVAGIYYWAASAGTVMRYDFGHPEIPAEKFITVQQTTGTTCVGCHVLSRDGTVIAVGLDIPGPAALEVYDVATTSRMWTTNNTSGGLPGFPNASGANFFTLSPDNQKIAASSGTNLTIRSAVDGTGMTTVVQNATMPDWSPDGQHIVFSRAAQSAPAGNPGVDDGSLVVVDTATFATEKMLVQSNGANYYYPAYSPDGNWIVFDRSANTDSYDQPDARVFMISANGGDALQLFNASPSGGDSWPKWSTEPHSYAGGDIFWLTFSSRRPYGLRGGTQAQIWMVGIDPARAAAGQDPSFTSFWLPFQDFTSGNHIAQWAETVVRTPCDNGMCPVDEFCDMGECLPVIQ